MDNTTLEDGCWNCKNKWCYKRGSAQRTICSYWTKQEPADACSNNTGDVLIREYIIERGN